MLVDALLEANALELLVQRLGTLDEKVGAGGGGAGKGASSFWQAVGGCRLGGSCHS